MSMQTPLEELLRPAVEWVAIKSLALSAKFKTHAYLHDDIKAMAGQPEKGWGQVDICP